MQTSISSRLRIGATLQTARRAVVAGGVLCVLVSPAAGQCPGDCDGDGSVTVDELIVGTDLALSGASAGACTELDLDGNDLVTINELVAAVDALIEGCPATPTPTPTATPSGPTATPTATETPGTPTATPSPSPTRPPGVCGDGVTDFAQGETCDDGNTDEGVGDNCPANCRIATCTASGSTLDVDVSFEPPVGVDLAAIQVFLRYPEEAVRIPGRGASSQVMNRFSNQIDGPSYSISDQDYAAAVFAFTGGEPIPAGRLFTVTFDTCQGPALPAAGDFTCTVVQTSPETEGVSCTVTIP